MVVDSGYILIVGGVTNGAKTERCALPESGSHTISCREQTPDLKSDYERYPELFIVEEHFCPFGTYNSSIGE